MSTENKTLEPHVAHWADRNGIFPPHAALAFEDAATSEWAKQYHTAKLRSLVEAALKWGAGPGWQATATKILEGK